MRAVVVGGPIPGPPARRLSAGKWGKHPLNVTVHAVRQPVPAGIDVLQMEECHAVVLAQQCGELDGESGFACARPSVHGNDQGYDGGGGFQCHAGLSVFLGEREQYAHGYK